jgi:Fur family transcriptional regulator, iron response regulator
MDVLAKLRSHGISPTAQRVAIAGLLFSRCEHLSAEEIYCLVNEKEGRRVSKATVYNTLGLLAKKGVVREVIADPSRVFYDPNTSPHHHFYDVDTGRLSDIDATKVEILGLPSLPAGTQLEGVEVIVRLRSNK